MSKPDSIATFKMSGRNIQRIGAGTFTVRRFGTVIDVSLGGRTVFSRHAASVADAKHWMFRECADFRDAKEQEERELDRNTEFFLIERERHFYGV